MADTLSISQLNGEYLQGSFNASDYSFRAAKSMIKDISKASLPDNTAPTGLVSLARNKSSFSLSEQSQSSKTPIFNALRRAFNPKGVTDGGYPIQHQSEDARLSLFKDVWPSRSFRLIEKYMTAGNSTLVAKKTMVSFLKELESDTLLSSLLDKVRQDIFKIIQDPQYGILSSIDSFRSDTSHISGTTSTRKVIGDSTGFALLIADNLYSRKSSPLSQLRDLFMERHHQTAISKKYYKVATTESLVSKAQSKVARLERRAYRMENPKLVTEVGLAKESLKEAQHKAELAREANSEAQQRASHEFFISLAKHLTLPPKTPRNTYSNQGNNLSTDGIELVQNLVITAYVQLLAIGMGIDPSRIRNMSLSPSSRLAGIGITHLSPSIVAPGQGDTFNDRGNPLFVNSLNLDLPYPANKRAGDFISSLESVQQDSTLLLSRIDILLQRILNTSTLRDNPNVEIIIAMPQQRQGKPGKLHEHPFLTRADTMVLGALRTNYNGTELHLPLCDLQTQSLSGIREPFYLVGVADTDKIIDMTFQNTAGVSISSSLKKDILSNRECLSLIESPDFYSNNGKYQVIPNYEDWSLQVSAKSSVSKIRGGIESRRAYMELAQYLNQDPVFLIKESSSTPNGGKEESKAESPLARLVQKIADVTISVNPESPLLLVIAIEKFLTKFTGSYNKTTNTIIFDEGTGNIFYEPDIKTLLNDPKIRDKRISFSGIAGDVLTSADPAIIYSFAIEDALYTYSLRVTKLQSRSPHAIIEIGRFSPELTGFVQQSLELPLDISYKEFVELIL